MNKTGEYLISMGWLSVWLIVIPLLIIGVLVNPLAGMILASGGAIIWTIVGVIYGAIKMAQGEGKRNDNC